MDTLISVHTTAARSPDRKAPPSDIAGFQNAHSALLDLRSLHLDEIEAETVHFFTDDPRTVLAGGSTRRAPASVDESKKRKKPPGGKKKTPPKKEKKRKRRPDVRLFTFAKDGFECPLIDDGCKNPHETTKRRPHPAPPKDWYQKDNGAEMNQAEKLNKRVCHSCYSKLWYRKNKAAKTAEAKARTKLIKAAAVRDEALAILAMDALDQQ